VQAVMRPVQVELAPCWSQPCRHVRLGPFLFVIASSPFGLLAMPSTRDPYRRESVGYGFPHLPALRPFYNLRSRLASCSHNPSLLGVLDRLTRPLLRLVDPEDAHSLALAALRFAPLSRPP